MALLHVPIVVEHLDYAAVTADLLPGVIADLLPPFLLLPPVNHSPVAVTVPDLQSSVRKPLLPGAFFPAT